MAEEVVAPDWLHWVVRRRWDPRSHDQAVLGRTRAFLAERRPKRSTSRPPKSSSERAKDGLHALDIGAEGLGCAADATGIGVGILVVFVVGLVAWFVVIPLLLLVVDLAVLVVLVIAAVLGRVLFRRPWIVEARAADGTVHRWEVVGWRASGDHARLVAQQLRDGLPLPS